MRLRRSMKISLRQDSFAIGKAYASRGNGVDSLHAHTGLN